MRNTIAARPAEEWVGLHCDYYHPGSRDTCNHCQEMIRIYGLMPAVEEMSSAEAERRMNNGVPSQAEAKVSDTIRWEIWERDNFTCVLCGSRRRLTIDHIIPVSKGGTKEQSNLQTLCRSCNGRKGDTWHG